MEPRPLFVVVDGLDGCGKSTLTAAIEKKLWEMDVPHYHAVEPSLSRVGAFVRSLIHTPEQQRSFEIMAVLQDARVMAHLFAADRLLHSRLIVSAMSAGKHVVCDRWFLSSLVYQSDVEGVDDPKLMRGFSDVLSINRVALEKAMPDLVVFPRIRPEVASERIKKARANWGCTFFEGEVRLKKDAALWEKAVPYYRDVFNREVLVVDGESPTLDQVNSVMNALLVRFPWFPRIPKCG